MSTSALTATTAPASPVLEFIRPPRLPFGPCSPAEVEQLQAMTHAERVAALSAGQLSYAQCFKWASWRPWEVPQINGEFAFIAAFDPNCCEPRHPGASQTRDRVVAALDAADVRARQAGDAAPGPKPAPTSCERAKPA